jgi:hypothetical protein
VSGCVFGSIEAGAAEARAVREGEYVIRKREKLDQAAAAIREAWT